MAKQKLTKADRERTARMEWWHQARFGMFVHWGLYSQLGRHEWVMNRERIPMAEYEQLAQTWKVKPRPAREWARLARKAGMKYMVMTTKHHEGFCLWDTKMTDYNAVRCAPGRDLVQEYVDACREFDLKIGFYYSLMDWHHPDGVRCARSEPARRRFIDFTHGCVRELMSNYGKIDILWYDVSWPLSSPELWESRKMSGLARRLQPGLIVNNRAQLPEDFGTPEEHISAAEEGRAWEACMTFNGSWGYMPYALPEDWHSSRDVLLMVQQVTSGGGNLLLNIGPAPDGSVPPEATERLVPVGKWLAKYGDACVYGDVDRAQMEFMPLGRWTRKGRTLYFWCSRWPGEEITFGGFRSKLARAKLARARLLPTGKRLRVWQQGEQIKLSGMPKKNPDPIASIAVIEMEFASQPRQILGAGYQVLK
ncbi:MAG: alpha-L-fucosidase [Gemmatimonadota bacterium]